MLPPSLLHSSWRLVEDMIKISQQAYGLKKTEEDDDDDDDASIDFWCQLVANLATTASWMSVVAMVG